MEKKTLFDVKLYGKKMIIRLEKNMCTSFILFIIFSTLHFYTVYKNLFLYYNKIFNEKNFLLFVLFFSKLFNTVHD